MNFIFVVEAEAEQAPNRFRITAHSCATSPSPFLWFGAIYGHGWEDQRRTKVNNWDVKMKNVSEEGDDDERYYRDDEDGNEDDGRARRG